MDLTPRPPLPVGEGETEDRTAPLAPALRGEGEKDRSPWARGETEDETSPPGPLSHGERGRRKTGPLP